MMGTTRKRIIALVCIVAVLIGLAAAYLIYLQPQAKESVIVYGPSGLRALGYALAEEFTKRFGINVTYQHFDMGAIEIADKLMSEKDNPSADVIIGVPDFYAKALIDLGAIEAYDARNLSQIPRDKLFDLSKRVLPLDEGYVLIVYNETLIRQLGLPIPSTLDDLLDKQLKGIGLLPESYDQRHWDGVSILGALRKGL
ncbi:MAG: extracellular solute-binding protein [Nitrososphaeria archaeon]